MQKAITFLLSVWSLQASDEAQFFFLATKSIGGTWKDHPFEWPVTKQELTEFFDRYPTAKYHLYFCPHGFTKSKRKREYAASTTFLWADLDGSHPQSCSPKPQIAWESSPDRYAALWRLNRHYAPDEVEAINQALSYNNGADRGGWDFSQVLRIPGTKNHKYPSSPTGRLMWQRDNQYPLSDFPDEIEDQSNDSVEDLIRDKRMKSATRRTLMARHAIAGTRSETIWRLENELHEQGFKSGEIFKLIKSSVWNKFRGRRDEDKQLKRELEKVRAKERDTEEKKTLHKGISVVRMSDVKAEQVQWLWWPYIPLGKLTIVEGDPGLGKSWITMALSTHISLRKRFPGQDSGTQGTVLIMSAEDGLGDTIRPRLDTMQADVSKIYALEDPVTLDEDGIEDIDEWLHKIKPKLVIIDPVVAYMGGRVDLHKANETREVMARLSRLAENHHCAIVAIRHLTKGGRDKSIYRGIGSIDITAAARSVILVGRNPDKPNEGRVLCHIKCNLAPLGRSQAYVLDPKSKTPFRFEGPVDFTAEEVFKAEAAPGEGKDNDQWGQVCEWLREALEAGDRDSEEIKQEAEARGYDKQLLNRVRKDLSVKMKLGKKGRVMWSLA